MENTDSTAIIKDKMLGCLYGQAIGDALGLGTEFMNKAEICKYYPQGISRYDQIIQDYHRYRWVKGDWTDDTDMMLCILDGYNDGRFDTHLIASNFKDWFNNEPMGIGGHTFKVLCMGDYVEQPENCSKLWWDLSRHRSAANGALMRTSVVGLAKIDIESQAERICKLTHYDPRCIGSCVIASLIIHNLVWNDAQLSYEEVRNIGLKYDERISEWIDMAYNATDISQLNLDESHSMGYTLKTLSAALWCYWHAESFENGLLSVINEGGDADSNAAISCAILGAKYGYDSIPAYYVDNLLKHEMFNNKAISFIDDVLK